jgi:hypothetical protein
MTSWDHGEDREMLAHHLLLSFAGRMHDDRITRLRFQLAADGADAVADDLASAALAGQLPLTGEEREALLELLGSDSEFRTALEQVEPAPDDVFVPFRFAASPDGHDAETLDELDAGVVAALEDEVEALGLWRAWRYPDHEPGDSEPRRVYLVEVEADDVVADVPAHLQNVLGNLGESDPQVEVFEPEEDLPIYHRHALTSAALIWAAQPAPQIQIAAVFDVVDPHDGPAFHHDRPTIDHETDRERILAYLRGGTTVLSTTAVMDDVVDVTRCGVVPMSFRTDGTWVWTDTVTYYLQEHRLAPDAGLVAHIRACEYEQYPLDWVAMHRVMAFLRQPSLSEPVWTAGAQRAG